MTKAIVSLSGGMDSTTVLAHAVVQHHGDVAAVGFTYGSKHNQYENAAAERVAQHYGVPYKLIDLSSVMAGFKSDLMKSGGAIPEGHYEAASMSRTVVPGRNIIFASILAGIAWSEKAEQVWLGIHAGDHFIYPDCRPAFFEAMRKAVLAGTGDAATLVAPFLFASKADIVKSGLGLDVPYKLTRTCYADQEMACGRCGSCQERLDAFAANKIEDPLAYESRVILPKEE